MAHCNGCSTDGDGSCACSVHPSFELHDFAQSSWDTCLYSDPTSAILKTNDPPLDEQLPSLRANQVEAMTELEKVNQKIQSLQSLLSDAISHRAHLRKVIDDYRTALSPIRRIPFEIVHRILQNTARTDRCRAGPVKPTLDMDICNGPWRLSKVCRLWRAVAIQSPEFWCDIQISFTFNNNYQYRSSGLCALLDEGIRRSASRGLRVRLHQDDPSGDEDDASGQENEDNEDVIRAIFARSSQIRALEIEMQYGFELEDIISPASRNFRSLQRLSIKLEECDPIEGFNILQAFDGSLSLVDVKLSRLPVRKPYRYLNFPWNQLQTFEHERSLSRGDTVDVVRLCPRLQKYTGSNSHDDLDDPDFFTVTPAVIHHTAITHLGLSMDSLSLLQHTTIPSLTVLRVSGIGNIRLTELSHFISQSQCSIHDLHLTSKPLVGLLRFDPFLQLLPSLTRFTLVLHGITQLDEFQSALQSERLPRLEVLKIELFAQPRSDPDPLALCTPGAMSALIRIIQSRLSNLYSFTFYPRSTRIASSEVSKLLHENLDLVRALLVPYSEKLRVWIEGGMELQLFLGRFSLFQSPCQCRASALMDVHNFR
jgi:hypothetical protein